MLVEVLIYVFISAFVWRFANFIIDGMVEAVMWLFVKTVELVRWISDRYKSKKQAGGEGYANPSI